MFSRCHKNHPLRPPAWRHELVRHALEAGEVLSPKHEDAPTIFLFRFEKKLRKGGRHKRRLSHYQADYYAAKDIYYDVESDTRAIVEARLLAGESIESIASKMGIAQRVIEVYMFNYFDVQSRLDYSDYIHGHVLNYPTRGDKATHRRTWLKRIAYGTGQAGLDLVLRRRPVDEIKEEGPIRGMINLLASLLLESASASAARLDPSDLKSMRAILNECTQQQVTRAQDEASQPQQNYEKHIAAFLDNIQWGTARKGLSPELKSWSKTAVELSAADSMRVARGEKLEHEEWLRSIKAPGDLKDGEENPPPPWSQSE